MTITELKDCQPLELVGIQVIQADGSIGLVNLTSVRVKLKGITINYLAPSPFLNPN